MFLDEWLARDDLPRLEFIVDPWLPVGGIVLMHGDRGVSKTNVAMAVALEVANGSPFLDFKVPHPRKVLYIDGEMQRALVRDRLRKFVNHTARPRALRNLCYVNYADYNDEGFGDLADPQAPGRKFIEERIAELRAVEGEPVLLILDNKSSLLVTPDDNASTPQLLAFLRWLLKLRAWNVSTLLIHHAGKPDKEGRRRQHGSSATERYPDTIIQLSRAADAQDGVVPVRWSYEKERSFTPDERELFLNICYDDRNDLAWLEVCDEPDPDAIGPLNPKEQSVKGIWELNPEMSVRDVAVLTGIPKSTVGRIAKKLGRAGREKLSPTQVQPSEGVSPAPQGGASAP